MEFLLYHSIFTNVLSLPTSKKETANISKHTEGMLRNLNRMWPAWREGWLISSTYCTPTKYILHSHQIFPCQPGLMVTRIEGGKVIPMGWSRLLAICRAIRAKLSSSSPTFYKPWLFVNCSVLNRVPSVSDFKFAKKLSINLFNCMD